jgi:PAS domain S-box-containing protein
VALLVGQKPREKQFRILFEAAPNGVMAVDAAGLITMLNAQVAKMFGYTRQELIGRSVQVLVPKRFRRGHVRLRKSFAAAPQTRSMGAGRDLLGVRKDGSEFPVEIGFNHFAAEMGDVIVATVVDITKRKWAEEQKKLLHQAEALMAVFQKFGMPAAVLQSDGRVLLLNPLMEKLRPRFVFKADRIKLSNTIANKLFMQAVASLESASNNDVVRHILLPAVDGQQPFIVRLMRIVGTTDNLQPTKPLGIVTVTKVGSHAPPSVDLLKTLFNLTPAEARVAELLGSGLQLQQVAERLGVSKETTRTELAHVFTKVGVSHQSQLTALMAMLSPH